MKTLITSSLFFILFLISSTMKGAWAQSDSEPKGLDSFLNIHGVDVTLGWNQSNQSITNGVLLQTQLLPTFNFNAENSKGFVSVQNGAGLWLLRNEELKVGVAINYMLGRYARYDPKYIPLGDVSGAFDAYTWLEWQPIKDAVTVYANYARTLDAAYRSYGQFGITLGIPVMESLNAFVDLNFNYANQTYLQRYYGVDARQALSSARNPFVLNQAGLLNGAGLLGLDVVLDRKSDLILGAGQLKYSKSLSADPLIANTQQPLFLLVWNQKLDH